MTTQEAFELVTYEIEHLDVPYASRKIKIDEVLPAYPLRPEQWIHISFHPINAKDTKKVFDLRARLFDHGIYFDTGMSDGVIDWELDWSFKKN
jgi:hypothetical protein